MAIKLSKKEFDNLGLNKDDNNIQKKSYSNRLSDAIKIMSAYETDDKIYFNEDGTKCLLEFNDILLISNNDSLRLGAKQMQKYKKLWAKRIAKLVSEEALEKWGNSKNSQILIEFLYEVKVKRFMDYDGRLSAFKSPLDGLTRAGLLIDDSEEYVPLILGKQKKSNNNKCNLKIILSVENNFDRFYSKEFLNMYK